MNIQRLLIFAAAGFLAYGKLSSPSPHTPPDLPPNSPNTVIIELEDKDFPQAPLSPELRALAEKLIPILTTDKNDALSLANAYRSWDNLLLRDNFLKDTDQFQRCYKNATISLYGDTQMAGKYGGNLDTIINSILIQCLTSPERPTGLEVVSFTQEIKEKISEAFQAVSWASYEAFLQAVDKEINPPHHLTSSH